jgi:hypothetical protein
LYLPCYLRRNRENLVNNDHVAIVAISFKPMPFDIELPIDSPFVKLARAVTIRARHDLAVRTSTCAM